MLPTCGFSVRTLPKLYLYLYRNSDCDSFTHQFLLWSFFVGGVSICYITLGNGSKKCYIVLHRVGVWSEKNDFCVIEYVNGSYLTSHHRTNQFYVAYRRAPFDGKAKNMTTSYCESRLEVDTNMDTHTCICADGWTTRKHYVFSPICRMGKGIKIQLYSCR